MNSNSIQYNHDTYSILQYTVYTEIFKLRQIRVLTYQEHYLCVLWCMKFEKLNVKHSYLQNNA